MKNDGTIKFSIAKFEETAPHSHRVWREIEAYRSRFHRAGLIGFDEASGFGFGNISSRGEGTDFVITATQTGHLLQLDGRHYCRVTHADFERNQLSCSGPAKPSSEALSHAAFYTRPQVGAVVHVHNRLFWHKLIAGACLSTPAEVSYGSPELYRIIAEIMNDPTRELPALLVTIGHQDGVFAAGRDLEEVWQVVASARLSSSPEEGE
ncbi:MAG TPA: class II aldolase/adducin family protein [Spirochaetia bacterium]|nr:class II aldolase/adducin family protein [Spirochaetia bacterium]